MTPVRSVTRSFLTLLLLLVFCSLPSRAQSIIVEVAETPLVHVLETLRTSSSIDVVFAGRLVEDVAVTCSYRGDDPVEALACVLSGTGLQAERVRRRQFVIVAASRPGARPSTRVETQPRQTVAGFVRDAETGEILPGAHVFIPTLRIGATTNDAGYFAIAGLPGGEYEARISYIGYNSLEPTLTAGSPPQTFRLERQPYETGSITVETDRNAVEGMPPPSGVVSVPVRELERLPTFPGEQDLLHALQWFPGVQKAGEVNGGLIVRGGSPDQNLYLLDGAPVYHPWHAFSLISTFQTETFSDVKLYRGAFPAEHGGRISSVLDAQLKDGNRDGPRAIAALGVLSGRFMIESPLTPQSSFMISGRRSYLDKLIGVRHPVEDDEGRRDTLRTGYFFHDLAMKASVWSGSRHRLSVSYYRGGDDLDLRLPFDLSLDFSSWLRPADLFFEINQRWANDVTSVRYQYLLGTRFFTTFTAYRSGYAASEGAWIMPSARTNLTSDYTVSLTDVGFRWDAEWYFALSHELRVGIHVVDHLFRSQLDAQIVRTSASADTLDEYSRQRAVESAAYVQNTWRPSSRLSIQPGFRFAFFSGGEYVDLSPRLGIQYAIVPDRLMLRGAGGRYVQYMHRLRDRYSFLYDLVSSRWIATGDDVRPSVSHHLTGGVEVRPISGMTLSSDVYWYEAKDILLPEDDFQTKEGLDGPGIDVGAMLGQYAGGYARAYGIEINGRYERGRWEAFASYTGSRSLAKLISGSDDTFRPGRFDVPRSFRALIGRNWGSLRTTISSEARSGYAHTVPVARYVLDDPLSDPSVYLHRPEINNGRLPPYYHVDFAVQYQFRWAGARWTTSLHLYNITNRRNVISRQYHPTETGVDVRDRRGLPILPLLEVEMRI